MSQSLFSRNSTNKTSKKMEQKKGTRDLFLETLTKIGCQYETGEGEDDLIHFAYQGEDFHASIDDEHSYIFIYDLGWYSVELYDIDEIARLRKAINDSNWENMVTTMFNIDNESQRMDVISKVAFLFIPEIPDLEGYLRVELNEFFQAHYLVNIEMMKLREKDALS